jgi:hypothetical protein
VYVHNVDSDEIWFITGNCVTATMPSVVRRNWHGEFMVRGGKAANGDARLTLNEHFFSLLFFFSSSYFFFYRFTVLLTTCCFLLK